MADAAKGRTMHLYTLRRDGSISYEGGRNVIGNQAWLGEGGQDCPSVVHCIYRTVYSVYKCLIVTFSEFKFT